VPVANSSDEDAVLVDAAKLCRRLLNTYRNMMT